MNEIRWSSHFQVRCLALPDLAGTAPNWQKPVFRQYTAAPTLGSTILISAPKGFRISKLSETIENAFAHDWHDPAASGKIKPALDLVRDRKALQVNANKSQVSNKQNKLYA